MKIFDLKKSLDDEDELIKICLDFFIRNGGSAIPNGKYSVDKDGIFLNVMEYTTCLSQNGKWEAHKEYADLHIVIEGEEYIHVSDIDTMETGDYSARNDCLECKGEAKCFLRLNKNNCVLLLPEDAHMPGISIDHKPSAVKKAVFKIPVRYLSVCES